MANNLEVCFRYENKCITNDNRIQKCVFYVSNYVDGIEKFPKNPFFILSYFFVYGRYQFMKWYTAKCKIKLANI